LGKATYILGISAFYHDSAACLLRDGEIVAAAQEERFTRRKGDASFPEHAIDYCLRDAGVAAQGLSYVGFYDKPLLKFERILETYLGVAPRGFVSFMKATPLWIKEKLYMEKEIRKGLGYEGQVLYAEHHESHAASAFFPSPYREAAILTMDGVGEWATASSGIGRDNDVELYRELRWPDLLGLLYSAFTYYTGFKVNSGEYKVMGLAPYGEPKYVQLILVLASCDDRWILAGGRVGELLSEIIEDLPVRDPIIGWLDSEVDPALAMSPQFSWRDVASVPEALSTLDVYGTLFSGAALHLVPSALNLALQRLAEFIRKSELTQWCSVPSVLKFMPT